MSERQRTTPQRTEISPGKGAGDKDEVRGISGPRGRRIAPRTARQDDSPAYGGDSSRPHGLPLEPRRRTPHAKDMIHRSSGLGDPDYARFAWGRFRAVMAWMTVAAAACSAGAIVALAHVYGPLHLVTMLAVLGGVGGSVMLAGALMGLVFLSSGTGHDEDVEAFNRQRRR